MEIKKSTWYIKLLTFCWYYGPTYKLPRSLCTLWWSVFFTIILLLLIGIPFVITKWIAKIVGKIGPNLGEFFAMVLAIITCIVVIIGLIFSVEVRWAILFIVVVLLSIRFKNQLEEKGFFKKKKEKICPLINYID